MLKDKKETVIVQISDLHVGESDFVPSLLTRCVDEINELNRNCNNNVRSYRHGLQERI